MSEKKKNSKSNLIRIIMADIEADTSNSIKAREYLSSQGMNIDQIVSTGLKKIKQMELQIQARKTQSEMKNFDWQRQKAIECVERLLSVKKFSFPEFVRTNEIVLNYRNLESFTNEDIKEILIQHFTLKFLQKKEDDSTEP